MEPCSMYSILYGFCLKKNIYIYIYTHIYIWPHHMACRILVPWAGIEPASPALEAWRKAMDCQGSLRLLSLMFFNALVYVCSSFTFIAVTIPLCDYSIWAISSFWKLWTVVHLYLKIHSNIYGALSMYQVL